jgi:hypothetical protein
MVYLLTLPFRLIFGIVCSLVALPFALLMLAFAILGGSTDTTGISPDAGGAFGLGLLWGAIGSALGAATALPLREAREVFERDYLIAQISRFSGNISRTAEFVGMERSALHRKLKALGVG